MELILLGIIFLFSYECFGYLLIAFVITGLVGLVLILDSLYLKYRRR